MNAQGLSRVEHLCAIVYGGAPVSEVERIEAHTTLMTIQTSAHFIPQCRHLLDNSKTEYCLLFASRSLLQIVTRDWKNMSSEQRLDLVSYLMRKLANIPNDSSNQANSYITRSIIQVVCRITRLGWCVDEKHRGIYHDVVQFLQAGGAHAVLGLRVLSELINEFDHGHGGGSSDAQGRLAAESFREQGGLTRAFKLALDSVQRYNQSNERMLLKEALHTLYGALSYDFVGTGSEESDEVVACLYLPSDWAKLVARAPAIHQLFDIYKRQWQVTNESEIDSSQDSAASMCLQCIVLLVAVRRSVFDPTSRQEFLVALLDGTTELMREKMGLSHSEACLHHLCRVLARIKNHFQLIDLTRPPQYRAWLEEFAKFTEGVLGAWRSISTRSVHYLMRLWASLVLPTPYLQVRDGYKVMPTSSGPTSTRTNAKTPNYLAGLDVFVPGVVRAFVRTRADICANSALAALDDDGGGVEDNKTGDFGAGMGGVEDDPLDDEGMLLEQLAPLSILTRYRYGESAENIATLFNEALNQRQQALVALTNGNASAKRSLTEAQARLSFLTYLIGAIVGGHVSRVSASVIDRLDELNAELAALVFRMVISTQNAEDQLLSQNSNVLAIAFRTDAAWKLELAALYFFRCFQNLYIESRAKDDVEKQQMAKRSIGIIEDAQGYINLAWSSSGNSNSQTTDNKSVNFNVPSATVRPPIFKIAALPAALPSMDAITSGGIIGISASTKPRMATSSSSSNLAQHNTTQNNKNGGNDDEESKKLNDGVTNRASSVQRGIAARLGVPGGDRTLLDIAMRRIFGLLQHAQQNTQGSAHDNQLTNESTGASTPVVLVQRALNVLYQLSVGMSVVHAGRSYTPRLMSSGRLLLESEVIQDLLNNPDAQRFPLLMEPKHGRARSFLMATLAKLLFTQIKYPVQNTNISDSTPANTGEESFIKFIHPLTERTDMLFNVIKTQNAQALRNPQFKQTLIGLFRDLRGIVTSATVTREYELVFAWLIPTRIQVLAAVAESWFDITDVMIPLLKLLSEIVYNRGSRIVFPPLSVGGLILFKEASRVLVSFCAAQFKQLNGLREQQKAQMTQEISHKVNSENTIRDLSMITGSEESDPLSMGALREAVMQMGEDLMGNKKADGEEGRKSGAIKLSSGAVGAGITVDLDTKLIKCARICIVSMNRMLGGRYAQLGTFELYQDRALLDARRVILEVALLGKPSHVMSFPKMAKALVVLLNVLADKFVMSLISLPSPLFARMMACLAEAIASNYTYLSTPAASAVENISIFRCKAAAHAAAPLAVQTPILNPEHRSRGSRIRPQDLGDAAQHFAAHDNAQPELFGELLTLLLDRLLSNTAIGETSNQWTLARPVMPLVLCAPQAFINFRTRFLGSQSVAREPMVRKGFDELFSKLTPAITNNGSTGPNPQHFNAMLKINDQFTKAICAYYNELKR